MTPVVVAIVALAVTVVLAALGAAFNSGRIAAALTELREDFKEWRKDVGQRLGRLEDQAAEQRGRQASKEAT